MKTMICLLLDRSGSMGGRETDVVGGVNTFISEQRQLPDPATIAMVRFDTGGTERFRTMADLAVCEPMRADEFVPRGGTPLLDAIGITIAALEDDWKREKPERAIVVVVTDGMENASREFTKAKIKELIEARQASGMWAFIYLGANVDAFAEGGGMGFSASNTAGFVNSAKGTKAMYEAASASVHSMRATGHTLATNLGRNIGEDESKPVPDPLTPPAHVAQQPNTPVSWQPPVSGATTSTAWTPPA